MCSRQALRACCGSPKWLITPLRLTRADEMVRIDEMIRIDEMVRIKLLYSVDRNKQALLACFSVFHYTCKPCTLAEVSLLVAGTVVEGTRRTTPRPAELLLIYCRCG
ncbi:hypothetical protein KQX54_000619 [Cotesia glomerata]|uniref:Uncharacterized protein n=1 Tax=Cotesia glomerata TaxID=32391 RepID=A0AAV7HUX3_COTGL|nr:hypothetical protein KQX54_000619 [Cotesia glomerata]